MVDASHDFGGDWTELKLEAISAYSTFFTTAISQKFDLWYVDPFAGTGERTVKSPSGGLFVDQDGGTVSFPGSATRALILEPPFDHLRFGDAKLRHVKALEELKKKHLGRDIDIVHGDANNFIQEMFSSPFWTNKDFRYGGPRALVFLDPYGMQVKWRTLETLSACGKADVWFLANMKAAWQQASRDPLKLDDAKRRSLDDCFGTNAWESEIYSTRQEEGLLGLMSKSERADKADIARYHKIRLKTLFAYVSDPLPLKVKAIDDYFLLYCMSNSPSLKAQGLIKRGAEAVIRKYKQASRHKSALQGDVR